MRAISFMLYPVFGIPEQIRRRIDVNAGAQDLAQLSTVVNKHGEGAAETVEFSMAMSDVVGYDGTATGFERPFVDISGAGEMGVNMSYGPQETGVYNWIAVLVPSSGNLTRSTEDRYIMSGYTSRAEPSLLGRMPDDMRLYINDIYCVQATYMVDGLGQRVTAPNSFRVLENYVMSQALQDQLTGTMEFDVNPIAITKNAELQRKLALDNGMTLTPDTGAPTLGSGLGSQDNTYFASNFQTTPQLIAAQMTGPEGLVTTMAKGYMLSVSDDGSQDRGTIDSFFTGAGNVVESYLRQQTVQRNLNNHEVIRAMQTSLSQIDGVSSAGLGMKGNFTLGNLLGAVTNEHELHNWIANSISMARSRGGQMSLESTDDWVRSNGMSTPGSLVGYDLAMQLGPILSRNLVGAVRFIYDNRHADLMTPAHVAVVENSVESTNGGPLDLFFARRLQKDLEQLMIRVSKHNRVPFTATVICRLGTVTRIEIMLDGALPEKLTFASFMSNRMHVGITTSNNYVGELGKSVKNIMSAIDMGYEDFTRRSNITNHNSLVSQLGGLPSEPTVGGILGGGMLGSGNSTFNY